LPGLDGTGHLFAPLLGVLSKELRPQVISYPAGHPAGLDELAALVLRRLPQEKIILLAESFSGLVALALLANSPARLRGIIFVGAFAEPPRPLLLRLAPLVSRSAVLMRSAPSFLLRQYCLGKDATAADLKLLRETIAGVSPAVLAHRLELVGARHSFGRGRFEVPARYIRASGDRLVPARSAQWFQQRFRNCAVEEIDGPHFLLQAKPGSAARAIERAVLDLLAIPG
jgi:pimeloyl-[acyl-carrier protein] methyl ester esterase